MNTDLRKLGFKNEDGTWIAELWDPDTSDTKQPNYYITASIYNDDITLKFKNGGYSYNSNEKDERLEAMQKKIERNGHNGKIRTTYNRSKDQKTDEEKEYTGNMSGYFYHLIHKKYASSLKKNGLVPRKMENIYMYIDNLIEEGMNIKIPRHLEAVYVGKTIKDAETGRNSEIGDNDIICRFKKEVVKNYIYDDAESYNGDESYVILIHVPPELIEVSTNRTNGKWIPLENWDVENVAKLSKHRNGWYKGR